MESSCETAPAAAILPPSLAARGPAVIGATGGSGTRVFATVLRAAGVYTGRELNAADDALPFARFAERWINAYLAHPGPGLEAELRSDLRATIEEYLDGCPAGARWGWKAPRSIFLLPFLAGELPTLRFLHVVRDGRDIAFSANQNQLRKHGDVVLGPDPGLPPPVRSIRLWARINLQTLEFAREGLAGRYLRLRFEDLCERPGETISELLRFFELEGDAEALAREVRRPPGLGRWRAEAPELVARLEHEAGEALEAFGYAPGGAAHRS